DRGLPIFAQNDGDAEVFAQVGFTDVRIVDDSLAFGDVTITRTRAQHGSDAVLARWGEAMGQVSGYVLAAEGEPTVYIVGDAVWTAEIADELRTHCPAVTVLNTGAARWADGSKIIMGAVDVAEVHNAAPEAQIVGAHRPTGRPSPSEPERSHDDVFGALSLALAAGRLRALSCGVRRCRSVGDTTSGSWRRPARSSAGRRSRWSSRRPRRRVRSAGLAARAGGGLRRGARP